MTDSAWMTPRACAGGPRRERWAARSKVASRAFTLTPDNPRALSAEEYAEVLKEKGVETTPYPSVESALSAAREAAKRDGVPLVCLGSLYTYSSVIDYFEKGKIKV